MYATVDLVIQAAIAALLAWLGVLAWRSKNRLLKWGGAGAAGLLAIMTSLLIGLTGVGLLKLGSRTAEIPNLKVASTPERIHRGQAIAAAFCGACHSSAGTLTGGSDLGLHMAMRIGRFIAANLTPAGQLSGWSDGEIFRAIRNSVDAKGHWLIIMSITNASKLSDDDIASLIAYIRSVPAAGKPTPDPPDRLNPLGLLMLGTGLLPAGKPVFIGSITAPPKAATAEYGSYILSYHDCRACHGADLNGGVPGQLAPIGPSLAVVKNWKQEEFVATLRTGIDPNGYHLDSERMPWPAIGQMDDDELGALYAYLARLPDPDGTSH